MSKVSVDTAQASHIMVPAQLANYIPNSMRGKTKGLIMFSKAKPEVYLPVALANHIKGLKLEWIN